MCKESVIIAFHFHPLEIIRVSNSVYILPDLSAINALISLLVVPGKLVERLL